MPTIFTKVIIQKTIPTMATHCGDRNDKVNVFRGRHIYACVWTQVIEEELILKVEKTGMHTAITLLKDGFVTPRSISSHY